MPSEAIQALFYSGGPDKIQKLLRISIEQRIEEGRATSKRPPPRKKEQRHKQPGYTDKLVTTQI